MSKKGKAIIAVFSILLAVLIAWAVNNIPDGPDINRVPLEKRVVSFEGNTIQEEKDGRILWSITAANIEMDIDTKDASLTDVKAVFNFEDGRTVNLTAPKAIFNDKTHHLEVLNGVSGESSDGGRFSCTEIEWLAEKELLAMKGDASIEYEKEAVKASGDRIESANGFRNFKISGNAHLEKGN
ncbi:MAG: LPS export ABC transporter periplasmic protein LptC [Anaerovibrio sp.]|uniref:LPS export ABC transporter periplasmic protein LptC n=1 Tax=Anaerovibrio sp. TaxID=1872532 RepID=UPI0025EE7848|nr:LPS export ABC transporter periplasmic protein LptC [Anaerovibrio sp.]MCR5176178.1 LPS export ABC transporter periplasmic protein LptC [Anaerovibrio sp.]